MKENDQNFEENFKIWEGRSFFGGVLGRMGVAMFDSGSPARTPNDRMNILEKSGLRFDISGIGQREGTLVLKGSGCEDLRLEIGRKDDLVGVYLPFEGLTAPLTKWLRWVELSKDGNRFKLHFGDHPGKTGGEDTLTYTYKRSFSLSYGVD